VKLVNAGLAWWKTPSACQTDDLLWRVLKGCVQAEGVPDDDVEFDLVPVDAVARSIASLVGRQAEGVFHHANPALTSFTQLTQCLRDAGYSLTTLDRREWTELVAADPANAAHVLVETFAATAWGGEPEILLEPGESAYQPTDAAFIAKQVRYFQAVGFLPPPLSRSGRRAPQGRGGGRDRTDASRADNSL
jgi:hypothetical protein